VFDRILVPLDGSELAEAILSQVRRILLSKSADVILVRAVPKPRSAEANGVELPRILMAQATREVEEVSRELAAQGVCVQGVVRNGNPADVILEVAAEEKATLVTMSTHGRSGMARWSYGSVTEKVLRASHVPVLAVRSFAGGQRAQADERCFRKILVPISCDDHSLGVVGPALEFAKLFGSHVVVLHVSEGPNCFIPVPQMTAAFERFRAGGVTVEPLLRQGDPAAEILDVCETQGSDLIAMTTHGRAGVSRWMLGSVAEKVLRGAAVPVLVVRPAKAATSKNGGERKVQETHA
jgi:nucleotide-binding universal stress UspA family protein